MPGTYCKKHLIGWGKRTQYACAPTRVLVQTYRHDRQTTFEVTTNTAIIRHEP